MKAAKKIEFTLVEIEALQREAREARARWKAADLYPKKIYEEERSEFAAEYARGADPASSPKQQAWLKRIKKEVKHLSRAETRRRP